MKINELRDNPGARKSRVRVGRGIGSGLGKTAGRGQKGQKSRSGVSIKGFEGGKLDAKKLLDHDALKAAGLARGGKDGVRLLGKGEFKAKASFKVAGVSKGAREAVEKAGGSIEVLEQKDPAALAAAKKGKTRDARLAAKAEKKA